MNAAFSVACNNSATCTFNASASTGATTYSWNFGDGESATGVIATHTYLTAGSRTVTLTVHDGPDTATAQRTVACSVKGPQLRCK